MILKSERLNIRFIQEDDWISLLEIWKDFSQSEFAKYDNPHSLDKYEVQKLTKQWTEISHGNEHIFFAICLAEKMIGYIEFHKNDEGFECGYCFHSDYYRQGYAKESLKALIEWISNKYNVNHFSAGTALNNISSVKLLESLGFAKIDEEEVSFYKGNNDKDIYFTGGIFKLNTK